MIIGTGQSCGMGDVLLLTSICKYLPNCDIELLPKNQNFARFFRDQCASVTFTESPFNLPNIGNGHYAKCKMRAVGLHNKCCLPHVKISNQEKLQGKNFVSKYENPIAIVVNTSVNFKHQREVSIHMWSEIVNEQLRNGREVLQFGVSANFTPIPRAIHLPDIDINDLIPIYWAIGEMISVDTGDRHLMLACDGKTHVIRRSSYKYHHRWTYPSKKDNTLYYV